uniref:hypothetical protein n=1 Tax=Paenibacillus cymbidii TaxID=1639034 RepID=UPI001F190738|nr:hypothetical protein [Paenibacillus cymbidii]
MKPNPRGRQRVDAVIVPAVLEQAILLRREVPSRSVRQIIQILEWEGRVKPGEVKRSTLQEKLTQSGYSSRQMRLYESKGVAARRFQKRCRMALAQSDIKYGPYLPIGPSGEKKQVYLVLFEDDASRLVLHGNFSRCSTRRSWKIAFAKRFRSTVHLRRSTSIRGNNIKQSG